MIYWIDAFKGIHFYKNNKNMDIERLIKEKVSAFEVAAELIPGIKILQRIQPAQNLFICQAGVNHYGLTQSFFRHLSERDFRKNIFDAEHPGTCRIGIKMKDNSPYPEKAVYIKHGRLKKTKGIDLVIIHNMVPNSEGVPQLSLTQILPFDFEPWAITKIARIIGEMTFMKENFDKYQKLSFRNKEVLSLMVKSYKADDIGSELCIEANTVNTHKKKIKEVLSIEDNFEILKYGLAYDLVTF
jgi:DNA-binding CsgD family transcriptional regulator